MLLAALATDRAIGSAAVPSTVFACQQMGPVLNAHCCLPIEGLVLCALRAKCFANKPKRKVKLMTRKCIIFYNSNAIAAACAAATHRCRVRIATQFIIMIGSNSAIRLCWDKMGCRNTPNYTHLADSERTMARHIECKKIGQFCTGNSRNKRMHGTRKSGKALLDSFHSLWLYLFCALFTFINFIFVYKL